MNDTNNNDGAGNHDILTSRVEELEQRVVALEQQLLKLQSERATAPPERRPFMIGQTDDVRRPQQPFPPIAPQPFPDPVTAVPKPKTDWEHLIARVWLPRIFIAVLLIGVVWGFTAAVNAGIINEPIRCLLGIMAAGFMYWQGERQTRQGREALGQVLLGGSVAVVLLSLFAAHMLYELIPATLAFILYVLAIVAGVWTALRHRSQALTVIIMIAGYLVPFLVDSAEPNIWSLAAYETLFSITMIILAYRRKYTIAYITAFGVLHVPLLIGSFIAAGNDRYAIIIAVLLQHAVLFALSTFRQDGNKTVQSVSLFLSFSITALWMFSLLGDKDPFVYRSIVVVCALIYSIVSYWLVKQKKDAAVHMAIATFGWFLWIIHVLETNQISTATLFEGTLAIIIGIKLRSKLQQITGGLAYLVGVSGVLVQPVKHILSAETLAWLVLLASIGTIYMFLKRLPDGIADEYKRSKNTLMWVDSIVFLIFISQITNVVTRSLSSDLQHLLLSAVWVLYTVAVIVAGFVFSQKKVRLAGILFLLITLVKIIFIDLPDVSTAVRAILFIGLGSIGVAVSRLFYKGKNENKG